MTLTVVILAAGKGTRMHSSMPKVLQPLAGKALVEHVIDTAAELDPADIRLVYGYGAEAMKTALADRDLGWRLQAEQLGTGHAVKQALPGVPDEHRVLVLYGDVPLIRAETLRQLVDAAQTANQGDGLALLTVMLDDPTGYGRILRDPQTGAVRRIVEQKDAGVEELKIREGNTGILVARAGRLRDWLDQLDNDNAQGEYYLTDVVEAAATAGIPVTTVQPAEMSEVEGVNDKRQLAARERDYQRRMADTLLRGGVTLMDPERIDIRRATVSHGKDVEIDVNVILEGEIRLGDRVKIGPNVILKNCALGDDTEIRANSLIEDGHVGRGCRIGPYARLRPGARLGDGVHVGNFVEIKKSVVDDGSKVNHLTYVGDAEIGKHCNIGAGAITCNYDGAAKYLTKIGDDVFIGSNTALVAPIHVGDGATIGAGSTLSRGVPAGKLTLSRPKAVTVADWIRPKKNKNENKNKE